MYPVPFNEASRLEALEKYRILDTIPESVFDGLTEIVRQTFDAPTALISILDGDRQWFKSRNGLDAEETPRNVAFCAHAILQDGPLVVLDAADDVRFHKSDLVIGAPHIRFYAGAPLITPEGFRLGTLCVIDYEPRQQFGAENQTRLTSFATLAMEILEMRRRLIEAEILPNSSEEAEEARRDLFALVAHEIRSPIATMVSLSQIVDEQMFGPLSDPKYPEYLFDIRQTAKYISSVADRMLDMARSKTGEIAIKEEDCRLSDLLKISAQSVEDMAAEKNISIAVSKDYETIRLNVDPTLTTQMLTNLLHNAVKFTPENGRISLWIRKAGVGEVHVEIVDSGPGMSSEMIVGFLGKHADVGHIKLGENDSTGLISRLRFPAYRLCADAAPVAKSA